MCTTQETYDEAHGRKGKERLIISEGQEETGQKQIGRVLESIVLTSVDRVYLGKKVNKNEKERKRIVFVSKRKENESRRNRRTKKIKNEKWNTFEVFRKVEKSKILII